MNSIKALVPLVTLATSVALSPAAACFGQIAPRASLNEKRRVVTRARLTGSKEFQHVVILRSNGSNSRHANFRLAIDSTGRNPRTFWSTEDADVADINSVQVDDLDGDGLPEVIGLWWRGASIGATLRIVHWDRNSSKFVELRSNQDPTIVVGIHAYHLRGRPGHRRIVVYTRATASGWPPIKDGVLGLRGSEIVRIAGGGSVTPASESGIEGQAIISPVRPGPVREGQSDSAPYKTTLVVWTSDGREIRSVETAADGRFRVALPPGVYRVGPPPRTGRALPRAAVETVTVEQGRFSRVTISFDSGMR